MTIYVTGHKSPDTDTIISSIATATLLQNKGMDAIPVKQGEINPETKFVLEKFNLDTPITKTELKDQDVAIVDTTDAEQLPDDINQIYIHISCH